MHIKYDVFDLTNSDGSLNFEKFKKEFFPWVSDRVKAECCLSSINLELKLGNKKFVHNLLNVSSLAFSKYNDFRFTKEWMVKPNQNFSGKSPLEMCLLDNVKPVIDFLS